MIPRFPAVRSGSLPLLAAVLVAALCAGCGKTPPPSGPVEKVTLNCLKAGNGFGETDPSSAWWPGERHTTAKGSSQTLTATPAPHSQFAGWSGDLPGGADAKSATLKVPMDRDREIRADFTRELRTLDFKLEGKPEDWTLLPQPDKHLYLTDDTVLLYAVPRNPGTMPVWTGRVQPVAKDLFKVCLTGNMTVSLKGAPGEDTGSTNAPGFALDPAKDAAVNVPLRGGELRGWFSAPYTAKGPAGAGLSWLTHDRYANTYPFRWVSLNFEHVFNGAAADNTRALETPRRDPLVLTPEMPGTVRLHWPAAQSSWNMDCDMVYSLTAPNAVDVGFSFTPRRDCAPLGYIAFMWASYLNFARDGQIHFWGEEAGREGWCALGEPLGDGKADVGTIPFKGEAPLPVEPTALAINITEHPSKRFLKPVYYGLTDGDQDYGTQDDTMVVIMMFDREAPIRLALWNWSGNSHWPAWDWQFVIRDPKVDTSYSYRARMVYKPFVSQEDVMAEYEHWRASLPPAP